MSTDIRPGVHLRAAFWPEPVRVLTAEQVGNLFRMEVVGESGRFYGERWLRQEDLSRKGSSLKEHEGVHGRIFRS